MAKQDYVDELASWVGERKASKRRLDAVVVAFLAVKANVKAAMDNGYSLTTIWEHLRETERIKCSYDAFRKHVHKYIKNEASASQTPSPNKAAISKPQKPQSKPAGKITGFTFNPTPNTEDLF